MILCHGEMLIDFIPTEARDGTLAYRPAVGGSPGNVALTLARLDVPAGFVGGLSTDFFGEQIAATLAANGVAMDYVSRLDRPTMLAFVDLEGEEPRYAFYDYESARAELASRGHAADRAGGERAAFRLAVADPAAGGERLRRADAARGRAAHHQLRSEHPRRAWSRTRPDYRARLDEIFHLARRDQAEPAPTSRGSRRARTSRSSPPTGSRRRRGSCC